MISASGESKNATTRPTSTGTSLYREFQAVANGVDGDSWTPAVRHTIIP